MASKIVIGSRGSDLALWQAHFVKRQLQELGCAVEIKVIKTQGDQIQHLSFEKMEGKGFFTKEIEAALLANEIDLAVHSFKDLETAPVEGLEIAAVSYREDPRDAIIAHKSAVDKTQVLSLKKKATVGTSSARRKSQLKGFRPDIDIKDLRGNVPTRIQKLREGQYDAIMLAQAGLNRLELDLSEFELIPLEANYFIAAPAQGVLGLQIRSNDDETFEVVNKLNDPSVAFRIQIERSVLRQLDGGCQLPLGVYCETDEKQIHVWASLGSKDGSVKRSFKSFAAGDDPEEIASQTLQALKKKEP